MKNWVEMYEHAAISLDMLTHKTTTFTITEINIVCVYFDRVTVKCHV